MGKLYGAPPPVPRADVEKWNKKDPPGGGSGDAGGSKSRNDALILGLWQATLRHFSDNDAFGHIRLCLRTIIHGCLQTAD